MENKDKIVEIPERFKERIEADINVNNICKIEDGFFSLNGSCCLCDNFACKDCPLGKWESHKGEARCLSWIKAVTGESARTALGSFKTRSVLENKVKKLRKAMDKYIKWV